MKRIHIHTIICFVVAQFGNEIAAQTSATDPYASIAPSTGENYILSRVFQKGMATFVPASALEGDVMESITYFDGLGRPVQNIDIKSAPDGKDILTHMEYDPYGRMAADWLPYREPSGTVGSYRGDRSLETKSYYKGTYGSDFPTLPVADVNAYSLKEYEPSPLNRVLKQAAPGEDWKMGSGHEIVFGYDTNDTDEVRQYGVTLVFADNTYTPTLVDDGHYPQGELYKTITKDENHDGTTSKLHTTESYTDKLGHVVLKRTYGEVGSPSAVEAHDTHYVYDDYGNLTFVLPPKVDTSNGISATELDELCYQYKYDNRNRLVEKRVPGKGWEHIVYNKLDQPVMVQDAVQRTNNEWSYTKYDAFGRIIVSGVLNLNVTRSQAQANTYNAVAQYEEKDGQVYTDDAYPSIFNGSPFPQLQVLNYYDDYNFPLFGYTIPTTVLGQTVSQNVRGLPTGGGRLVLDGNNDKWVRWGRAYDEKGRLITEGTMNELAQTFTQVETKLDFMGRPEQVVTVHTKGANPPIVTTDDYAYDHMGRLTQQTRTIGAQTETIVENTYGELGQLVGKKVGGNLQTVDYEYNVRGWLRAINNTANLGNDLFAFDINYNTADHGGTPLYNGNISETEWKTANADNGLKWYRYGYDALNRIMSATDNTGNYNLSNVSYDRNGNILTLNRQGHTNAGATSFGAMDILDYDYDSGNKLLKVTDTGNATYGFKDGVNQATEYVYDLNGNLESDANKGINSITYNHLNLPEQINLGSDNIQYVYTADGEKLRKTVSTGTTTDYASGYVYENGTLQFFSHAEGYVTPDGSGGFDYVYQFRDHVDNIRLSYTDADGNGSIDPANEIVEENNYYPFGLKIRGYNGNVSSLGNSTAKKWKYNGVELEESFGLNLYEMDFRNYDAALARFNGIDPVTHYNYSPFQAFDNNPVYWADPVGADSWSYVSNGVYRNNQTGEETEDYQRAISETQSHFGEGPTDNIYINSKTGKVEIFRTDDAEDRIFIDGKFKGTAEKGSTEEILNANGVEFSSQQMPEGAGHIFTDMGIATVTGELLFRAAGAGLTALLSRWSGSKLIANANWAQKTFKGVFDDPDSKFFGMTVDGLSEAIKSGSIKIKDVPIEYVVRNGQAIIHNTRSSAALTRAGVPRNKWNALNRTGIKEVENRVTSQLTRNGLPNGTSTIKQTGTNRILSN